MEPGKIIQLIAGFLFCIFSVEATVYDKGVVLPFLMIAFVLLWPIHSFLEKKGFKISRRLKIIMVMLAVALVIVFSEILRG